MSESLDKSGDSTEVVEKIQWVKGTVDDKFAQWIKQKYGSLYNQPATTPVMGHHIPRAMAHYGQTTGKKKLALVVVDGLALEQWLILKEVLLKQKAQMKLREGAVFAWIPTVTSVSRQAIFAGKAPLYFPSSIYQTDREPALWRQFWMEQGLSQDKVAYAKGLGDANSFPIVKGF